MFDFRGKITELKEEMKEGTDLEANDILLKLYDYIQKHKEMLIEGEIKFYYFNNVLKVFYHDFSGHDMLRTIMEIKYEYEESEKARIVFLIIKDYFKPEIVKEEYNSFIIKLY